MRQSEHTSLDRYTRPFLTGFIICKPVLTTGIADNFSVTLNINQWATHTHTRMYMRIFLQVDFLILLLHIYSRSQMTYFVSFSGLFLHALLTPKVCDIRELLQ